MKRAIYIFGGLFAVLAIIVTVMPYLIPSSVYRAQAEKQAEAALGRDVILEGDARLSLLPSISVRVGGAKIANPEGFKRENMVDAGEFRARVKFLPLLFGRVEIAEISLVDADVALERLADGRANWEFGNQTDATAPTEGSEAGLSASVDRARLVNSAFRYTDAVTGSDYVFTGVTARASMSSLDAPLTLAGKGVFNEQAFDIDLTLDSVSKITSAQQTNAELTLKTDLGEVSYDGSFTFADVTGLKGQFSFGSSNISEIMSLAGLDLGLDFSTLGNLQAQGSISGPIGAPTLEFDRLKQRSDILQADFSGKVDLSSSAPLDGKFSFKTKNAALVASNLKLDLPILLAPVGSLDLSGTVKGSLTSPQFTFERFQQVSDMMNSDYSGSLFIGDEIGLNGSLTSEISNVSDLVSEFGLDIGATSALNELSFAGNLSGPVSGLSIKDARVKHTGPLLNLNYNGDFALGGAGIINGPLTASSNDLRGLLNALDIQLAPGETLKTFKLDGALSGTSTSLQVDQLQLSIDDVAATGRAGLNLQDDIPRIDADLSMPSLDLTPFLGESDDVSSAPTANTGWSKTPLALDGLKAVNADIELKAGLLQIGKVELQDADVSAVLSGGKLDTDIKKMTAFTGNWKGSLALDSSGTTPILQMDLAGQNVDMQSVMSTFANLSSISGEGNMSFSATSQGDSLDALVRGLNGELKTDLADGAVKGFNIAQIVRSLDSIQGALTSGSLGFALSPEAQTDFTQFTSALTIRNGVANIDLMRALNPAVLLDGKGTIDLASQSVDISITPSIDTKGGGELGMLKLNGEPFALPFRISGSWLAPGISIDNAEIAKQLRLRATNQLSDRIDNELSGILGEALGGSNSNKPAGDESDQTSNPDKNESEDSPSPTLDDAIDDLAQDALKDLFGRKKD